MKRSKIAALLIAAAFLAACPAAMNAVKEVVKPPTVSVKDVSVTGISTKALDLDLVLEIDNPNPVGLSLAGFEYAFDLLDKPLFSGNQTSGVQIKASGQSPLSIPVSISYQDVLAIYEAGKGLDELPYKLSGKVRITTPVGEIPVPYSTTGKLPVVRPPKLQGGKVNVRKLDFSGIDLDVTLNLFNPNFFDLDIRNLDYALNLAGQDFVSGKVENQLVPKKSTGPLRIPVSIDTTKIAWVRSLITKGKVDYSLDYNAKYNIKSWPVKQNEKFEGEINFGR